MRIVYQNAGDSYDLSEQITAATWTTHRTGAPAKLELSLLDAGAIAWSEGAVVAAYLGERGIFYGYVFTIVRTQEKKVSLIAYDQTRYLKNKDTYVFENLRADEVLRRIAGDYQLKLGEVANTGYVLPTLVCDGQGLFDMILQALQQTMQGAGEMFYLWDDFGALRLTRVQLPEQVSVIGEESLATSYRFQSSIDADTFNKIKLICEDKRSGRRDLYIEQDTQSIARWGVLQRFEKASTTLNDAQLRARCKQLLALHNKPAQSLQISALSLPELRAGEVIYCDLPHIGIKQVFLTEYVKHDFLRQSMQLKVRVI